MNQIEIFRPFNEAYELMQNTLFRPFDFKKWLVIGFAAWLGHIGAGFSFNYRYGGEADFKNNAFVRNISDTIHQTPLWLIVSVIVTLFVLIVMVAVLFAWLRARGRFVFADCIVRNRAAIVEPWREFESQGNSYFLFSLVVGFSLAAVLILLSLFLFVPLFGGAAVVHLHKVYLITAFVLWIVLLVLLLAAWMLISHLMTIIMYSRRGLATEAVRAAMSLIAAYPAEMTLYSLFWIVLGLAACCIACLAACFTCCLAALPYVGTVILLPVHTCLRAFGLRFLRQFGPEYDAWLHQPAGAPPPAMVDGGPSQ